MNDDTDSARESPGAGERVYAAPAEALEVARAALASGEASPGERAEALWVLGRSAYYANQMTDAVTYLREAVPLVENPALLAEILLTLAPAMSKEGRPEEALGLLESPALELAARDAGQLRNQRGIILTELGRLPEALAQMQEALSLLREAGDRSRECRTLVNLGAVSSMMGDLDGAEAWYVEAREQTIATGQDVVAAGIEGNLGYVESRRGNFAVALEWYDKARASFEGLGEVDLLTAVLEVDHARTLLDVGLAADAADAAEMAVNSARAGGNQMLETQSRLLQAEALIRLDEVTAAERSLQRGAELAATLEMAPWLLRARALEAELDPAGLTSDLAFDQMESFLAAGWVREALSLAVRRAVDIRPRDELSARRLLDEVSSRTDGLDADPIDRALARLLAADLDGDETALTEAYVSGLESVDRLRCLVGSVELRATIAHRLRPLRDAALQAALLRDESASRTLEILESSRSVLMPVPGTVSATVTDGTQIRRLRDARVAVEEAKLQSGDLETATKAVRDLEHDILRSRRSQSGLDRPTPFAWPDLPTIPDGTAYLTFFIRHGSVVGLSRVGQTTSMTPLGSLEAVLSPIRRQRTLLRRLADERRSVGPAELDELAEVCAALNEALLVPLLEEDSSRFILTTTGPLSDLAWPGLPSLQQKPVTMTPSLGRWASEADAIRLQRICLLSGPGLPRSRDEVGELAGIWSGGCEVRNHATVDETIHALAETDLVHLAAHGVFRNDNPFFSALVLADGDLSVLAMSELPAVPRVVILSSCDAGATAVPGAISDAVVGTANELRQLGARIVVAPVVAVNDQAAATYSRLLHLGMRDGASIDEAATSARAEMLGSGGPREVAAALSFQVFGGNCSRLPVVMEGI